MRRVPEHRRRFLPEVFFIFIFLSAAGVCEAVQHKMGVVASITPLADFARRVGGDRVNVTLLLPPGASPHAFEPSPRLVREIANAVIFIRIGAGLEFWADKIVSSAGGDLETITCSDGIPLLRLSDPDGHNAGGVDPHIWLDPTICISIVRRIAEAFARKDPLSAGYYRANAEAYAAELSRLDREIAGKVRSFRTREYVTFHSAWNYFSRRYGLKVIGVIEESPGKEPAPRHLGKVLADLKRLKAKVVFAEPQFNPKMAEVLGREAGAEVLILDPVGGTGGRESYLAMMRYNLAVMEKGLK